MFAVAAAPTGALWTVEWTPPTVRYITKPQTVSTSGAKMLPGSKTVMDTVRQVVTHNLTGKTLAQPIAVYALLTDGHRVHFVYSGQPHAHVPVWPGGSLWGAQIDLQTIHTITAVWSGGLEETHPWPPAQNQADGTIHRVTETQSIGGWWPEIKVASKATGVPGSLIAAIMVHESSGEANAYNPQGPAIGLMQILPSTAEGLCPGYHASTWTDPQNNLILGAELLAADYQKTGNTRWHVAIAAYYGGLGTMEQDGYIPGMPWSQAAHWLNVVPAAWAGNRQTMTSYANQMVGEGRRIAQRFTTPSHPKSS